MYTDHLIEEAEHSRWFIEAMSDPSRRYWIITANGRPVGLANIYDLDPENSRAKFAIYVADPRARGSGTGSFALFSLMQYAFRERGLGRLECEALTTNVEAIALYEKFGFQIDGILRDEIRRADRFLDVAYLSITAIRWVETEPHLRAKLEARGLI